MQDVKSEYKVLAAILEDNNIINRCRLDWFTENRRSLFKAMQELYSEHGYVTIEGIEDKYRRDLPGELFIPIVPVIQPVLETLQRLYTKRTLQSVAEQLGLLANTYDPNLQDVETLLLSTQSTIDYDSSVFDAGIQVLAELEQKKQGRYQYLSTGLPFLDGMLGGEWPRKAISAVVATPGGAKTALICNSALAMARLENPVSSLFISLEMSKEAILRRWAALLCEIDSLDIKSGNITDLQQQQIADAINYINTLPIYIVDSSDLSMDQISSIVRYHHIQHNVQVVFIDYLQIMAVPDDIDLNKALGKVGKKAKNLAKKLNIHICFISQLTDGKTGVWQVRGSGDFVPVLDVLIKLDSEEKTDVRSVQVEFIKQREGPLGKVPAIFDGRYQKFS